MKVSDVMHRSIITITEDVLLKEAGRLIFTLGIAGIPVVRGKKLVGVVTEQIILSKMHPTLEDLMDDYVHAGNFDSMIKNIHSVLEVSVGETMNPNVTTISPDAPLMRAHSLMQVNMFSRLPVVNAKNELLGVISQGDIFRAVLKDEIPELERERYAGFISKYYDQMVDWDKRFDKEFPALLKLFEDKNVKKILDVGVWTGEYAIGLAKRSSYSILGLDSNPAMIKMSNEKKAKLSKDVRKRINFTLTDYADIASLSKDKFDIVIFMGNSLPYNPVNLNDLFKNLSRIMSDKATVVIRLLNFDKILNSKNRLLSFGINETNDTSGRREQLSIEFLDRKSKSSVLLNSIIFNYDGINWIYKGITTIDVKNIKKNDLENILNKVGFKEISFFGDVSEYRGDFGRLSFESSFDPLKSDWLTVVAQR
jgi:CBS domain-containing protein/ubiquinone/menaquinone biosynthesis C-methylase UbiE